MATLGHKTLFAYMNKKKVSDRLIITPFLFIYAISSLFFAHDFIAPSSTRRQFETLTLSAAPTAPQELADILSSKYEITGNLQRTSIDDSGGIKLVISRPGTRYKVIANTHSNVASIETVTKNAAAFSKSLHITAGFDSEEPAQQWWGGAALIVAILMVCILVTGILLWTFRSNERRSGTIFLSASTLYCIIVLCALRMG